MLKHSWILVTLLLLLLPAKQDRVHACSGGGPDYIPLNEMIPRAEAIIVGHFVEQDDMRLNGIMEIEQFISANPVNKYLLLIQSDSIRLAKAVHSKIYEADCAYSTQPLTVQDQIVAFLYRNPDGSYGWYRAIIYTHPDEVHEIILHRSTGSEGHSLEIERFTLDQLVKYIEDEGDEFFQLPQELLPYPLINPILIKTEDAREYLLPVDGSPPVQLEIETSRKMQRSPSCLTIPCTAYSPNGMDIVLFTPEGVIVNTLYAVSPIFSGDAGLFSPTGDAFVLWSKNRLQIISLYYPNLGFDDPRSSQIINEITIDAAIYPDPVWTLDGRKLVYTDQDGLWLWDALNPGVKPRLLVGNEAGRPVARYFSAHGRYLAVTQGEDRYTLDVETGARFPDGLVSPDERTLLAFDTAAEEFEVIIVWLAPPGRQKAVDNLGNSRVSQVEWLNDRAFLMTRYAPHTCDVDTGECYPEGWVVTERLISGLGFLNNVPHLFSYGSQFDYDARSNKLVTLIDDTTIAINGQNRDLAEWLNSPITEVQWLPSLVYYD